jgi:D-alanine-D-alanine ligase
MAAMIRSGFTTPLRVGITYNLKQHSTSAVVDHEAEYDDLSTIEAISQALTEGGHPVILLEADKELPCKLQSRPVDIVFNIAEGRQGRAREAQVPALLGFYGIPYTGSDETTLCLALDKALTKRLLSTWRIRSPRSRLLARGQSRLSGSIAFPAIIKPNAEGSSKGISPISVVAGPDELHQVTRTLMARYDQDLLVEAFIAGREFTVGILGNGEDLHVFPPMEIIYRKQDNPYNIYDYTVKQNYRELIEYACPAALDRRTEAQIIRTARRIFTGLGCRDCARIDFRLSPTGDLYFIEINPLPGLAPGYSDFPMIAEFCSMDYGSLVRAILHAAMKRYGLSDSCQQG